ncbi:MAG: response regulator [Thermodesulfobacteriota bacterium]
MVADKDKVLIVDDSPTVRRLVELILSQNGFEIISAEDGDTGLELAREHHPRIILVDFVMPRMNGHMFCKALREDEEFRDVPVILISSKSEVVGQAFEESFGIVHYFTKPFEPDDLIAKINEVLNAHDQGVAATEVEQPSAGTDTNESATALNQPMTADIEGLLDSINDRFDKVVRNYFQKDFPVLMKNVLADTLKETGLVKHQTLIMSGDLQHTTLAEVLCFCSNSRQSGRLSVFSDEIFAEIFIEEGRFVFATASQKGTHTFLTDLICSDNRFSCDNKVLQDVVKQARENNIPIGRALVERNIISSDDLMFYLRQHAQDAFNKALAVEKGNFFLEKDELPYNLDDITFRVNMSEMLINGVRNIPTPSEFSNDALRIQRLPACAELMNKSLLNEEEFNLVTYMDGRTLGELRGSSDLNENKVTDIAFHLYMAGAVSVG